MRNRSEIKLLGQALLVGLFTGIVVGIFRLGIERMTSFWLKLFQLAHANLYWLIVIVIGLCIVGIIAGYFVKQYSHVGGSGIPEVKLQLQGNLSLSWFPILWRKLIGGILVISTGLFLGPEGPSLQLGATIGQGVGETAKQTKTNIRVLIATGAASGLAAAFGAPLSGALFVLEEVFHNFSQRVWLNALAGAMIADFVVSNLFGQHATLALTYNYSFPIPLYWHLLILGVLLGILGHLYKIGLFNCKKLYEKVRFLPKWLFGFIPLLLLIPIAYFLPLITGPGNRLILALPKLITKPGWSIIGLLLAFYVIRLIFSIISYDSGLPSGIFLPILTMGALIGAVYGLFMVQLHLLPQKLVINLIIFAMAGYFAAIIRAPFTAVILITEMVGSLLHLMPLAVVSFISLLVDELLGGLPIYDSLAQAMMDKQKTRRTATIGQRDQLTIPIYEDSNLVDQKIAAIAWPKNTLVKVIHRGGRDVIPNGQTKIANGDNLVLELDAGERGQVYDKIKQLQAVEYDG
ncbi:ClC family H(+)/Cl(-) exchange transporter [Lactobacillus sp. ESL0684]|uniref:ClC family H(+)/Cl(-) exchange transporter n=1 Tax=unclassified Lactobacillus TaxID=2620435 RepID=UPI0023F88F16|nr:MULTISPECIES: ClC family H(+)/Cl(-) exchange transporter [unclassified Lactobacillus]WEV41029.1 ClC family H(+)/Cl(-) exchange transporter [Lactobacillus sp. ESL0681]WEV44140.1 ClC family H(+)/Cl(-) exchange transporter [Lactobacillus sp. ESL0684]